MIWPRDIPEPCQWGQRSGSGVWLVKVGKAQVRPKNFDSGFILWRVPVSVSEPARLNGMWRPYCLKVEALMFSTQSDSFLLKLYMHCIKVSPRCPNKARCKLWLTAPVLESSVSEDIVLQTLLEDYIVCHLCWEAHLGDCVPLVCVTCGCEELSGAASNWIPPWLDMWAHLSSSALHSPRSASSRPRYTQTQSSIAFSFSSGNFLWCQSHPGARKHRQGETERDTLVAPEMQKQTLRRRHDNQRGSLDREGFKVGPVAKW